MRIALVGGHGKVAMLLAAKLVAAGHEVTSIIRNPAHAADVEATGAGALVADVESAGVAQLTETVRGYDTLVWSAGAGGGDPQRTYAVDRDAAIRSMDAAQAAGVQRYVMVSYLGSGTPERGHGVDTDTGFFAYAEAKTAADAHLREMNSLVWTIIKPGVLTTEPSTGRIDPAPTGDGRVSRELVAEVAAAVIELPAEQAHGLEFAFGDGAVPVRDALAEATAQ